MSHLWTSDDMIAAMAGRPLGTLPEGISGISIDSRSIGKGEAFFAIKGDRVDGHDFAGMAVANGAALIVVAEAKLPALGRISAPMIVVDDVLAALGRLAAAARARSHARIIAVTGSVGKTTTKEMLRHALAPSGKVHAAVASFNNHWGVPLTLARLPEDADFGVFEIGMNHAGEIRPLVKLVRPHVAVITTVAPVHIGHFGDISEIADAKAEIFEGLEPGGAAIINRDIRQFEQLEERAKLAGVARIAGFGQHARAEFRLAGFEGDGDTSLIRAELDGRGYDVAIGAPGRHIAENALAVLGACLLAGADIDAAVAALAVLKPVKGRGERHRLAIGDRFFTLIDESYNANPASMRAAIALLAETEPGPGGRRIAVLGDMRELGELSEELHRELASVLVAAGILHVWLAGEEIAVLCDALPESVTVEYRETAAELAAFAVADVAAGDVLCVKASNGLNFAKIISALLDNYPAFPDTGRRSE